MKNKKLIIIIVSVIGVILIAIGLFTTSLVNDKKETNNRMNTILKSYDNFENSILGFNEQRDKIYQSIFVETYYDTISANYNTWNEEMGAYEKTVDSIEKYSTDLKKYCNNYYAKKEVNEKCTAFKSLYEQSVNAFVQDVKNYNDVLETYNKYVEEENNTLQKLTLYKTDKKYIDYDKDGNYLGKE